MKRTMPPRLAQGQAGVYAVAAQLLLRGIVPCFPAVDIGADIYTELGTRLQVKCAHRRYGYSYNFCLVHGPSSDNRDYQERKSLKLSDSADFHVLWGIEDNRFWIVPTAMLEGRTAASMPPRDARYLRVSEEDILRDFSDGMKQADIARKHGLSKHAICDVVNKKRSPEIAERIKFTKRLLEHEDQWGLILDYERSLVEAQEAITVAA